MRDEQSDTGIAQRASGPCPVRRSCRLCAKEPPATVKDMNKSTIWTVLGGILAIIIAWWLVNVLFSVLAFVFKLLVVAVVAVIVFFVIRSLFSSRRD